MPTILEFEAKPGLAEGEGGKKVYRVTLEGEEEGPGAMAPQSFPGQALWWFD